MAYEGLEKLSGADEFDTKEAEQEIVTAIEEFDMPEVVSKEEGGYLKDELEEPITKVRVLLERMEEEDHDFKEDSLVLIANSLFAAGDYVFAERYYDALFRDFDSGYGCYMLGVLADIHGNFKQALEFYDRATKTDPGLYRAWLARGKALEDLGRLKEAERCYNSAVKTEPGGIEALMALATIQFSMGDYEPALKTYDAVLKTEPSNVNAWKGKAVVLEELGRGDDAEECYRKARLQGETKEGWVDMAEKYYLKGNYKDAMDALEEAISEDRSSDKAWYYRAKILLKSGKFDKALKSIEKALALNPFEISYLVTKGDVLFARGEYDSSIRTYDDALKMEGNKRLALRSKGKALIAIGKSEDGISYLKKANEINPEEEITVILDAVQDQGEKEISMALDVLRNLGDELDIATTLSIKDEELMEKICLARNAFVSGDYDQAFVIGDEATNLLHQVNLKGVEDYLSHVRESVERMKGSKDVGEVQESIDKAEELIEEGKIARGVALIKANTKDILAKEPLYIEVRDKLQEVWAEIKEAGDNGIATEDFNKELKVAREYFKEMKYNAAKTSLQKVVEQLGEKKSGHSRANKALESLKSAMAEATKFDIDMQIIESKVNDAVGKMKLGNYEDVLKIADNALDILEKLKKDQLHEGTNSQISKAEEMLSELKERDAKTDLLARSIKDAKQALEENEVEVAYQRAKNALKLAREIKDELDKAEASEGLYRIKAGIENLEKIDADTTNPKKIYKAARSAYDAADYDKAERLIEKCAKEIDRVQNNLKVADTLQICQFKINTAKKAGAKAKMAENLLRQARSAMISGKSDQAMTMANKCMKETDRLSVFIDVLRKLAKVRKGIEAAKKRGRDVAKVEKTLMNAKPAIISKDYDSAMEVANECMNLLRETSASQGAAKPKQPEKYEHNLIEEYTFDNFVVGSCNELAHAASKAVAEGSSKTYNPLFLYSGAGLGKTHLMNAVGHEILNKNKKARVIYTTVEKFTNELVHAIETGKIEEFRAKYRNVDALLIDDIQFISGREKTQEEFFHTFNELYYNNKQIVICSDRPPEEIKGLEERLVSRFEWGFVVDLQDPEYETRLAILTKKAKDMHVEVDEKVLNLIANLISTNIRKLEGSLHKVIASASLQKRDIDVDFAKNILKTQDL